MTEMVIDRTFYGSVIALLFLAVLMQLTLCIYMFSNGRRLRAVLPDCVIFTGALMLMSEMSNDIYESIAGAGAGKGSPPLGLVIAGIVTLMVYSSSRILYERAEKRHSLNSGVVRYALDRIAPGICFADHTGRIIMINRNMVDLMLVLMNGYPQLISEVLEALENPGADTGVRRIAGRTDTYRFPDGIVWKFKKYPLTDPELRGYIQIMAEDVTDIYDANEKLLKNTEELKATNESLREMYDMLADRIRDRETVNLKMSIHDNLGNSLLALSGILAGTAEGDEEKEIRILKNAVSYFSNDRSDQPADMEAVVSRAEKINVKVLTEGEFPEDEETEKLIAAAAAECVTNCVRHAGGSQVTVSSTADADYYTIRITNNGSAPEGKVTEGGGLSSLRRRAESAGVIMEIESNPEFALVLRVRRKERAN